MKKLICTATIILLLSTISLAEKTIRITNGEWEPFMSEYCPHYGVNSHIISEAFKIEGIKIKWSFYPWSRSFKLAKAGKDWDASATWWPVPETKESFLLCDPISKTSFVFFHLKGYDFNWKTLKDLIGLKIGTTLEYDYGKEFMAAMKEKRLKTETVPTDETNFKKLLAGRIQIFPNDPVVGYAQIRNSFPPDQAKRFTHHPNDFETSTLHLIISKKCKDGQFFLEKFNSGFKKLKDSGKYDKMIKDLEAGKYDKQKVKWKENAAGK